MKHAACEMVVAFSLLLPGSAWCGLLPDSLVAFDSEDGEYIVVRGGEFVEACEGRDVDSFTTGVVAREDGTLLVSYWRETHTSLPLFGGIDVIGGECGLSQGRVEFEGRAFHGIALGPNEEVWVTDSEQGELLRIDLESREIVESLPFAPILEDIDATGRFYIRRGAVHVLSPTGEPLFEIPKAGPFQVRVDRRGDIWMLEEGVLRRLSRTGELLQTISIDIDRVAAGAFVLTPHDTVWVRSATEMCDPAVTEVGFDGTTLGTVRLVDDSGLAAGFDGVGALVYVPAAEKGPPPRGSSSDGCQIGATAAPPGGLRTLGLLLLGALALRFVPRRRRSRPWIGACSRARVS